MNNSSQLAQELEKLLDDHFSGETAEIFRQRLRAGKLTKQENPQSHFCAYFAAADYKSKQLFIGHHKKSGLWLFSGGHIDEGELLLETVKREINEEWGLNGNDFKIETPALLTATEIYNPTKQPCRLHLDIWHFINIDKDTFDPDPCKLAEEFYTMEWMDLTKARQLVTDPSTILALDFIEANYFVG